MKNKVLYISAFLLLLTGSGCNKFLDKEPDNRAKLTTATKVSQLLSTSYPQSNYQGYLETMSDNVEDIGVGGTDREYADAYKWADTKENQQDSPEAYWYACYEAIAAANQALKTIGEAENQSEYRAQRGEALMARAYAHLMLVSIFSKFYDPTTAASDLGIPYVTEPENVVIKQYDRKTVQYVYDMVEKDMLEGLPLIQDQSYNVPKFHFNRAAATAFATRFYTNKRDWAKVIQYAGETVPAGNYTPNLRGWNDNNSPYRTITDVTELFKVYSKTTESANLLLVETTSWWGRNFYSERWGVGNAKMAEVYPSVDLLTGGNTAYKRYSLSSVHQLIPKIDEYFVKTSINANFGTGWVMVPLLTVEEVLFNHAEALYYTGDNAGVITLLNKFASRRILNYSATAHNITVAKINTTFPVIATEVGTQKFPSVLQAILYYKRMDFVHEGLRWFDILRYNLPVIHTVRTTPSITDTIRLMPNDPRRIVQLPESSTQAGLQQNPR
jgi:hypothetical protein